VPSAKTPRAPTKSGVFVVLTLAIVRNDEEN